MCCAGFAPAKKNLEVIQILKVVQQTQRPDFRLLPIR